MTSGTSDKKEVIRLIGKLNENRGEFSGYIFQLPEFKAVGFVVCAAIVLAIVTLGASLLLTRREPDLAKASVYECGFDPWGAPRVPFSVKFFLVGILFLIFDLEVSFFYPWSVCLGMMRHVAIGVAWGFLGILGLGWGVCG